MSGTTPDKSLRNVGPPADARGPTGELAPAGAGKVMQKVTIKGVAVFMGLVALSNVLLHFLDVSVAGGRIRAIGAR